MNKKYDITIIGGLGHVGFPLGLLFASKGLKVCLNDINDQVAKIISNGDLPYVEYGAEKLLKKVLINGNLSISLEVESISNAKYVIIAIGTPVDEYMNPKTRNFLKFVEEVKHYLSPSQIIIVRSSVFPRACQQILNILGEKENWHLAYCPERIAQGYALKELEILPQVVAGFTDHAIEESAKLFRKISKKIIKATMGQAELVKLFSNSYRYIQFAIANQFYMIANDFGENYDQIREIMIDGYDRAKGLPSAGFAAGPCLLKDTMQLLAFNNNQFQLAQAAMNINEGLPNYIVNNLKSKFDLSGKIVGVLGMAFKANVDDIRDSLSYKLGKILRFNEAEVLYSDEFVKDQDFIAAESLINKADIIIIGCPHTSYKKLIIPENKVLIDLWNIIP